MGREVDERKKLYEWMTIELRRVNLVAHRTMCCSIRLLGCWLAIAIAIKCNLNFKYIYLPLISLVELN